MMLGGGGRGWRWVTVLRPGQLVLILAVWRVGGEWWVVARLSWAWEVQFSSPQSCHVPLLLLPIGQEGEQEEEGEQWRTVLVSSLPSLPASLPASQSNIYHSEPANQHSVRLSQLGGFLLLPGSSELCSARAVVIHHWSACQDVYLQSKDTLVPRKSKLHTVGFNPGASDLTFIDTFGPLDTETILEKPSTAKTLPRSGGGGRIPCKIFASPENFKLSVRSLSQSSRSVISSSPEFMRK